MPRMMQARRQALRLVIAAGMVLTTGGTLNAAASPSGTAFEAVPVSPTEGAPTKLSAPPPEADAVSVPPDAAPGTDASSGVIVSEKLFPEDAAARGGHKLPCGLSYYENPPSGNRRLIVFAIGNCNNVPVSRAIDLDPDPNTSCANIPAHYEVVAEVWANRNQNVSHRGTGLLACR